MYHLIYIEKTGNQIYLNVDTLEVAKNNREIPQNNQSKSKAALSMLGIVSFCTTIIRIIKLDTSMDKLWLLLIVYSLATIMGVTLFALSKGTVTK